MSGLANHRVSLSCVIAHFPQHAHLFYFSSSRELWSTSGMALNLLNAKITLVCQSLNFTEQVPRSYCPSFLYSPHFDVIGRPWGLIVRAFRPQFGSYSQDSEGYAIADVPPFSVLYENALVVPSEFGSSLLMQRTRSMLVGNSTPRTKFLFIPFCLFF